MERQTQLGPSVRFGLFELDVRSAELHYNGRKVPLHEQPFQVLVALLERPGDLVSREELVHRLWPDGTFVDYERGLNKAVNKLRDVLRDSADAPSFVETVPRRGYRFIAAVENGRAHVATDLPQAKPDSKTAQISVSAGAAKPSHNARKWTRGAALVGSAILVIGLAVGGRALLFHKAGALSERDTIVLADFTNTTGDAVFDGTLREGLSVQLEQSPFLRTISDQQIQQTLQLMGQKPDAKLTPEIARELCQRTGSAAVLDGAIAQIGTQYLLTLKTVNCVNGESMASTEAQAPDKNHVLEALGKIASETRNRLGESISTVQKFDTPLEQATTPSLEALKAFSSGGKVWNTTGSTAAIPFFKHAIELDPNFAMAYFSLGVGYWNIHEDSLASENLHKAFELRENVSEYEKMVIEAEYYFTTTGNLEKARKTGELLVQTYPRDERARAELAVTYSALGQYDKALPEAREALRLRPDSGQVYSTLAIIYLRLNQFDEARATLEEAEKKKLDYATLHRRLYLLAFLQNDAAEMGQQVAWAAGKPGVEDLLLGYAADTAAHAGQLGKARVFSVRAVASAVRAEEKEAAANHEAHMALTEALFGNDAEARQRVAAVFGISKGRDVQYAAGMAAAMAGDSALAQSLADDLSKRFPEDTLVQFNYLPALGAQLALIRNDHAQAIDLLQAAVPYELNDMGPGTLYPIFIRGKAYLAGHQGSEAAVEFQKILDHRGIVVNEPIGALAHLGLARAYVLQGHSVKAKAAYQDFLEVWKNADPDIPILKQAKAEYAKLQ